MIFTKKGMTGLMPVVAGMMLSTGIALHAEVVLLDDFSEPDGTLIHAKPADTGGPWYSGSADNEVQGGAFVQVGSGGNSSSVPFTRSLGSGEVLTLTFTAGSGSVFADGWSGLTLQSASGSLSFGDTGSGEAWMNTGEGVSTGDTSAPNSVIITYAFDSGAWTLATTALPGSASGTTSSGLALDEISFWDDGAGSGIIEFEELMVEITSSGGGATNYLSYVEWAVSNRLTTGRYGDQDGDGLINLHEYGKGGNPTNAADAGFDAELQVMEKGGQSWLYYTYPVYAGSSGDLVYSLSMNVDLSSNQWADAGYEVTGTGTNAYAPGYNAVSNRMNTSSSTAYLRLNLASAGADEWRGADISMVPRFEELGGEYLIDDLVIDPVHILMNYGMNTFRVRLFVEPDGAWDGAIQDLDYVTALGQRIKNAGGRFLLDIHYSDTWADPGHQSKPALWSSLSFSELEAQVETYSSNVIATLKDAGCLPDMVQVGNEITGGFLWPEGKIYNEPLGGWANFTSLLKAGIRGCRQPLSDDDEMKIMIHIDRGGDASATSYFFSTLNSYGVEYDIIGLSFYPWWHGSSSDLQNTLSTASSFGKDIVVVETAYPWFSSYGSMEWDQTPEGQKQFVEDLLGIVRSAPGGRGKGIIWWYPEAVDDVPIGVWEGGANALFDSDWKALPALESF